MTGATDNAQPQGRPWAVAIAEALAVAERSRRVTGRDTVDLADTGKVVLVLRGTLNLFVVDPNGRRHGLAQAEAGEVVLGLGAGEEDGSVIGVPGAGTELLELGLSELVGGLESVHQALEPALEPALESWVSRLLDAVLTGPPPTAYRVIHAGDSVEATDGASIVEAGDDVVWVRPTGGGMTYLGAVEVPDTAAVPLGPGAWAQPDAGAALQAVSTREWLSGPWTDDLARFHHAVLTTFLRDLIADREAVWRRLGDRRASETHAFDGSIGALAAVGGGAAVPAVGVGVDPLLAAASMVAEASGVTIELPKGGLDVLARASDPLAMLAESSGFHSIPILLEGDWWRSDQGPMLAYLGTERRPVALMPSAPGRYEAVDPATQRRFRVTKANASDFARDARSFVRLLPSRPVSFREVLAGGLHDLQSDGWRLLLAMLLSGSVAFATPLLIEQIIGTAVPEADRTALVVLVGAMVAVAVAGAGFSIVQSLSLLRIEGRASSRTQLAVFARLLRLPTEFFRRYTDGDLSVRVRGVEEMRQLLSDNTLFIIMASVNGLFSLALMLYYEVVLALTVAGVAILVGLLNYYFGGRVTRLHRSILNIRGDVEADVIQYLDGITELRTNNAERQAFARWSAKFADGQARSYEAGLLSNAGQTTNAVFSFVAVLAIVVAIGLISDQLFAIFEVDFSWSSLAATGLEGTINPAEFMAFYAAFGQFSLAVNQIVQSGLNLTALAPTYDRLRPLLEAEEEHQEGDQDPGVLRGDIDVREVQFRYVPEQPLVLKGVSLSAKAGQFVAVVGPSGAGKSSLMRLLLGFDNPEAGSVFLDGQDLRHLNKRAVRRNFGVVLQTVKVMTGTIFENITSGTDMSEEDAWWAAEQVGFAEDIRRMPDGLHTMLSDGGSTLSGGQCQRLMLARAVIRRPRIMLLDEATSALDNEVQSIVTEALDKLNCTRIVIAHRLSTIANADLIYVIDAGRVVEHGTYDDLMALDGVFAQLARRQLSGSGGDA